ncbi:hypothetical protein LCGC14_2191340 [marine sediment metagenome]|uniref:Uncharacterized protein n=1 Tax=marine sediment metagenome TaxID=412755 RepID=A0A0F9GFB9_9ZZZZ
MKEIDLGERPKEGIARSECENCSAKFTRKKPHHIYCSDCIRIMYREDEVEDDEDLPEVRF